jgi:CheY-like chemotaxis protein
MSAKFLHRPGTVVVLDDDTDYLEALLLALPTHWPLQCYANPKRCMQELATQQRAASQWRDRVRGWIAERLNDKPLLPTVLTNLIGQPEPYAVPKVLVVDYAMPAMNGLEVLARLPAQDITRVLLTGIADERLAVQAFNQRLIEHFLSKKDAAIGQHLRDTVQAMQHVADVADSHIWGGMFCPAARLFWERTDIQQSLHAMLQSRCVEYYFFNQPLGVLGFDASGRSAWLQVETAQSRPAMLEVAQAHGLHGAALAGLVGGHQLLSVELQQVLECAELETASPALPIGDQADAWAAWFDMPVAYHRTPGSSYQAYCAQLGRAVIQ